MLKIKVKHGSSKLSMRGSFEEITAELLVAINSVYRAVEEADKDKADVLKRFVCQVINDPNDTPFANQDDETKS